MQLDWKIAFSIQNFELNSIHNVYTCVCVCVCVCVVFLYVCAQKKLILLLDWKT